MPQEYFDATIHVLWPQGKRLAIHQVQALDADRVLHQLQVVGVSAYGLDAPPPRKRVTKKPKRK